MTDKHFQAAQCLSMLSSSYQGDQLLRLGLLLVETGGGEDRGTKERRNQEVGQQHPVVGLEEYRVYSSCKR